MNSQTEYQAQIFTNRCAKKLKTLRKWARKNGVCCYRVYDRDIPEVPLAVDLYEFLPDDIASPSAATEFINAQAEAESQNIAGAAQKRLERIFLKVFLYERPAEFQKTNAEEEEWLLTMCGALAQSVGIPQSRIVTKTRKHEKGGSQYAASNSLGSTKAEAISGNVYENGSIFFVNLSDYLDTGLFLDMRKMRSIIKAQSKAKSVLNLFCYTSSFSVAAMAGGAAAVQSVDLSNTYLEWSQKNFLLNGFCDKSKYEFTRSDVAEFLQKTLKQVQGDKSIQGDNTRHSELVSESPSHNSRRAYDIIILDPPTFSNSKKTQNDLDLNRDWNVLVNLCLKVLNKNGVLYFSTNSKRLAFDTALIENNASLKIAEITQETIDADFEQKRSHRVWRIEKNWA